MSLKFGRIALAGGIAIWVNGGLLLVLLLLNRPPKTLSPPAPPPDFTAPLLLREAVAAAAAPAPATSPARPRPPEPSPRPMPPHPVFAKPALEPLAVLPAPADPLPQAVVVASQPAVAAPDSPDPAAEPAADDDIPDAEGIDRPPRELGRTKPRYPAAARQLGQEGEVTLKLLINARGEVEQIRVLDVVGHHSFERAVLAVARQWRFSPPLHRGRPVRVWAVKTVKFQLEE